MPALYAPAPADPDAPGTMTKTHYDQPPTLNNDGPFYPIYPEFYDFGSDVHGAAAAAACGGGDGVVGGGAGGQLPPDFSAMAQTEGGYPPGWDYGLVDVELPCGLPQDLIEGEGEGHQPQLQPQPQVPWDFAAQAYPAMMGGQGTMPMDGPMAHYAPGEEPMGGGGCYEPLLGWRPPPLGQISPSPSQSSYHASSPAASQFSRHNSCSSLTASMAAAVEQARFDARFQPEHTREQALSPGAEQQQQQQQPLPYDGQRGPAPRRNARNQAVAAATGTTDYSTGAVTPAFTPSPKDSSSAAAVPSRQQGAQGARHPPPDQKAQKSSGKRAPPAAGQAAQKKKQHQQQQQQQETQPETQPPPAPSAQRTRNRAAANKCRAKTKLAVADLESTERAMSTEHRELSATARGLRDEVLLLKNELLAHGNCDDVLIQQYLTNQARMVGSAAAAAAAEAGDHQQHHRLHHQQ